MTEKDFFYRFGRLLYQIDGFYAAFAKKSGVKENLLWILYALNDGGRHSQKEICESWDLPRSTVNTIIKELESGKYIELLQIKGEKRELYVRLTGQGKEYAENLLSELYRIEKYAFDSLDGNAENIILSLESILKGLYKGEKTTDESLERL